jgi:hypothetical protein
MWGFFVFIYVRDLIRKILSEEIVYGGHVLCDNCGWSWKLSDGGDDKYICHKCGHDNTPKKTNFTRLLDHFKNNFPESKKNKVDVIQNFVEDYINSNNIVVKFLHSCKTGYSGVRTKDQVIICSPMNMGTIGDFLYTIFHEIRHEHQIRDIQMGNPLVEYDLDDFEKLYQKYWEMELDADKFAKHMIAELVIKLDIPIDFAQREFGLSPYIKEYPSMSKMVEMALRKIVNEIKDIKKSGGEFTDIQDHPMVKKHLKDLERFI